MNPIIGELPTWVQILIAVAPLGVLVVGITGGFVALIGAGVAFLSYLQRRKADMRAEWWRRVQFATSATVSEDVREGRIGDELLAALVEAEPATKPDKQLLLRILKATRGDVPQPVTSGAGVEETADRPDPEIVVEPVEVPREPRGVDSPPEAKDGEA